MITPQQTETEFDNFAKFIGFTRVSDKISDNPTFKNADYINQNDKIIIELKVLNKEHFEDGGLIDSLNALIVQPKNVNPDGTGQYTFTLPDLNRENKYDNFQEPLRSVLKKANRQIRETKDYFFDGKDANGYVILAPSGLSSLSTLVTAQVVKKILDKEFSSINGAIICTPHERMMDPVNMEMNPECVSVTKDNDEKLKDECMKIADEWIKFYENNGHSST